MASSAKKGKQVPKLFSAQQALDFFMELGGDTEESDLETGSDSEVDVDLDNDRFSSGDSEGGEQTTVQRRASPLPGPSGEAGRNCARSRCSGSSARRVVLDMNEGWKTLAEDDQGFETTNNFRFIPKDGRRPGLNVDLDQHSSPLTCFMKLFDDEVCDHLIQSVNQFAELQIIKNTPVMRRSRYNDWYPLDKYELMKFLSVLFSIRLDLRPCIGDFFSSKPNFKTDFYGDMFARDRFEVLYHTMLHVGEPDAVGNEKIELFVNLLLSKFNAVYTPFQSVSIDEMIIGWKGRWKYKQYNASKPKKYHIKSFGLVDSATGFVINLLIYFGSETSYDPELDVDSRGSNAIKIFHTLLEPIGRGYHIFADRWYTTRALLEFLLSRGQHFSGTVQAQRVGFPQEIKHKQLRLKHLESKYWMEEEGKMLCVAWRDKKANKPVILVSTNAKAESIEVAGGKTKPAAIHSYNFNMNGCDRADQMVNYYGLQKRKSKKWWKKIFFWVLEIACVNAHILYCFPRVQDGAKKNKLGLKAFKEKMIEELNAAAALLMPDPQGMPAKPTRGRPRTANPIARLEGAKHIVIWSPNDRRCQVCSTPQQKKRSNFMCESCQVYLHPKDCFKR